MDINDLKNTSDEQFKKNLSFEALMPNGDGEPIETGITLTVKSARNPAIRAKLAKLLGTAEKERAKLDRANITDEQYEKVVEAVGNIDKSIAKLMLVKFEGLTDNGKPYPCNKETMESLVDNHEWLRSNIVQKAVSEHAFYKV